MCWPVSGCNVLCCRLFRWRVRCARSLSCTQLCCWSWWTHWPLKLPLLSFLDGLKLYLFVLSSLELFDVISVWLLLCYKSFEYCACRHYWSRDDTDAQRLDRLRSGRYKMVSEHDHSCRTRPLSLNPRSVFSSHFWLLSIFHSFRMADARNKFMQPDEDTPFLTPLEGSH